MEKEGLTEQAQKNRNAIAMIKARLLGGEISYQEAEVEAQPLIDEMNQRGAEISKEYGMKFKPLSFKYLMR